jgi:hypothetical protein
MTFHVQTEDWGEQNPFVVTRIFQGGRVYKSFKTPYETIISTNQAKGRQAVQLGMREQHQKVLDQLVSGALIDSPIK